MLRLSKLFKNYRETGSLNEQINLYGFIGPHVFLTKTGEVGVILELHGVDYECLDPVAIDGLTKRLESALKLFDENCRVYQYLFKRNNETIPYKLYANPIVDAAIKNRIAYLRSKADTLFSLSLYIVVLYEGFQTSHKFARVLSEMTRNPKNAFVELRAHFSTENKTVILGQHVSEAQSALLQKSRSFILQISDFLTARLLDKQEVFRVLKKTLNFHPDKLELAKLKHDTFLDYYLPESTIECHRGHLRVDDYYGHFSLTVVIYDLDLAKVDRACADFYKVFSVHDAQIYEEKYNLLNAFLAAVPGNHVFNLRSLYLLNTNYADFSFLFTLHCGEPRNPHLRQEYLAVLETNHHTPYFLNLHYRDVAHTMILGRTGAGKSFLLNFLITNLQKYDPHTFIFDLGGSFESLTQLFAGSHVRVRPECQHFRINPFSLPPTNAKLEFIALFLKVLIQGQKAGDLDPTTERE